MKIGFTLTYVRGHGKVPDVDEKYETGERRVQTAKRVAGYNAKSSSDILGPE